MDKIFPLTLITDTDPVPLTPRDPTAWYTTTYVAVDTETTTDDQLMWLISQGWIVYGITIHNAGGIGGSRYYTWYLYRRVMSGEETLKAMVEDYTVAYNEGRELNDGRYDDIVAVYAAVIDEVQDGLIALVTENTTYDGLIDALITSIETNWSDYNTDVSGDLDDYGTAETLRINTQFNSELSKAQNTLINNSMYNATTWASVSAGIERERAFALSDLNDKILILQTNLKGRLYDTEAQMRDRVMAARDRVFASDHTSAMAREDMRERIIVALCNFMERRTDSYPDLTAIGNAAAELGAGSAISGGAP